MIKVLETLDDKQKGILLEANELYKNHLENTVHFIDDEISGIQFTRSEFIQ